MLTFTLVVMLVLSWGATALLARKVGKLKIELSKANARITAMRKRKEVHHDVHKIGADDLADELGKFLHPDDKR